MAALSSTSTSTFTSFPLLNNKSPLQTITFPSNYNTHLPFPLSNSKRLNFSLLKAKKKDFSSNNFSEVNKAKNEPNGKKKLKIGTAFYDDEELDIVRKKMDEDIKKYRLRLKNKWNKNKRMAELLEKYESLREAYNPLDLVKLSDCFDDNTFSVNKVERFESGGMFYGNLRVPVDQALRVLEKKLSEAAGKEVIVFFHKVDKELELVTVQQKSQMDLSFGVYKRKSGYVFTAASAVTTLGTVALMSGFFLNSYATFDYYLADVLPLFCGFLTILGVSEIATRVTAARYGVILGPSILVPSIWTGCLGITNDYESLLPNMKALFDIPVARTASAYLTSILLILSAFVSDGNLNGGDNPLYIKPDFFFNNPLVSLIQLINGDDLSNRLLYEVDGIGVTVDPLAFAGLLGMIVTSLNLLPCGTLEGRHIFDAMFGRKKSKIVSYATHSILLGIGAISGSVLFVAWAIFTIVFQSQSGELVNDEKKITPLRDGVLAQDEITPLGEGRYVLGFFLALTCFLTLFPNAAGTFSSWSLTEPYFWGFV